MKRNELNQRWDKGKRQQATVDASRTEVRLPAMRCPWEWINHNQLPPLTPRASSSRGRDQSTQGEEKGTKTHSVIVKSTKVASIGLGWYYT